MVRSPTGKVITVPVCLKQPFTTDGQNAVWNYIDLPLPEVEDWGPFLMGVTAHTRCESMTANVQWKVVSHGEYEGAHHGVEEAPT